MKKSGKTLKTIILIVLVAAVVLLAGAISALKPIKMLRVFMKMKSDDCGAVFISQFPLNNYSMTDYEIFFGKKFCKVEVNPDNYVELCEVLAVSYVAEVNDRYVGLSFNNLHESKILKKLIDRRIGANWTFIIEPEYVGMVNYEFEKELGTIQKIVDDFGARDNVLIAWMGWQEAIYCYNRNYDEFGLKSNQVNDIFLETYRLRPGNVGSRCDEFRSTTERMRVEAPEYPDFSDLIIIYAGDSIIANSIPENSIPKLVEERFGNYSLDLSVGGATCAYIATEEDDEEKDLASQIATVPFDDLRESGREYAFVVNVGLNDFFDGFPVYGENEIAYEYSLRKNIYEIRSNAPEAQIFIMSPTYVYGFLGEEQEGVGNSLDDFRQAAQEVAAAFDCVYVDNYTDLGINETNYVDYYVDDMHPNAQGRMVIADNLMKYMTEYYANKY